MKFSEKLAAHLTLEWRQQYIKYEMLKNLLVEAVEKAPQATAAEMRSVRYHYANYDELFYQQCDVELKKINNFFAEKIAEATRKHTALVVELQQWKILAEQYRMRASRLDVRKIMKKRRADEMRFAFSEFYLSLVLLQNYQTLNHTGFRKILKKHDKLFNTDSGSKWFKTQVDQAPFYTNHDLMNLIRETEDLFAQHLEGGDRARAMKRLRVPPLGEEQHPWTTFRVGLFMGAFLVVSVALFIKIRNHNLLEENYVACLRLYRGPFLFITFLFLFSMNVYGWRFAGVNHILIFEINPRDHLTASHISELASMFALIGSISMLGFLYHQEIGIPPYVHPLLLMCFSLAYLFNPLRTCHYRARLWFIKLVGRVVAAPFFPVGFPDFWLGDQMNSLVTCIVDYKYILCFYATNWDWYHAHDPDKCMDEDYIITGIVRCLPAWFRFWQCIRRYRDTRSAYPFLVNAGKYATTFPVICFSTLTAIFHDSYQYTFDNPYVWGYLISYTISSFYCYAWDVLKDFGVFAKFSGENIFLRDQILYRSVFYYFAIIEDFLLRFFWVLVFYLTEKRLMLAYHVYTIAAFLEVFRRYIWNYFRLENEHLFNAGMFRAVRDISLRPLDPGDQVAVQRMMDEMDGVNNRRQPDDDDEKED